ncbi:MAG: hypothetical protein RL211_1552 [Pseudomonadota bacterium]|jgi:hypothetical protein
MDYTALAGQRLQRVEVFEPWRESGSQRHAPKGAPLLCGALVMVFENAALICTSPLRYLHSQQGTQYGLPVGESVSLGYRITTCDREDVKTVLPITFGLPPSAEYSHTWMNSPLPAIGMVLTETAIVEVSRADGEPAWGIELRFASGLCYWLSYRPELDGSIKLDVPGQHFDIGQIVVDGPEQDFGWLHPATPLCIILDDQVWRSAKVADWPLALRKALQSHQTPEVFYRDTMRRALTARFRQTRLLRQRLLALRYSVQVKDVPDGLIEEIARELRREA